MSDPIHNIVSIRDEWVVRDRQKEKPQDLTGTYTQIWKDWLAERYSTFDVLELMGNDPMLKAFFDRKVREFKQ